MDQDDMSSGKKRRPEQPSPVVFLWNLPSNASEGSLREFCFRFGQIVNMLLIQRKRQALVEFEKQAAAENMVELAKTNPMQFFLGDSQVHCAFSKHCKLTLREDQSNINSHSRGEDNLPSVHKTPVLVCRSNGITTDTHPRDILMLVGESGVEAATRCVAKILVLGRKNIAFIQFHKLQDCIDIEDGLKKRHVYLNRMHVDFSFSKREFLEGPHVEDVSALQSEQGSSRPPPQVMGSQRVPNQDRPLPLEVMEQARNAGVPLESIHMVPAVRTRDGYVIFDDYLEQVMRMRHSSDQAPEGQQQFMPKHFIEGKNKVVMITNLNEEQMDCDKIFTLCGAFGDVAKVKIAFAKRDTAFVQMVNHESAQTLCRLLQGITVFGNSLSVRISKMEEIRGITDQPVDTGEILTKDYTASDRHRYRSVKYLRNINVPGSILHVSNLNKMWVEQTGVEAAKIEISAFLGDKDVAFVPKSTTQCFVECGTVENAVGLLILHHFAEFHERPMRISFSSRNRMPRG